ncbi:MAG: hypothetical protein AB7P34_14960 [Vicinamibacterales bacterium]
MPGDLGDSLLNMWILAWGAEHLPQLLTGSMSWAQFWDANIFHPSPLALSLSEHLFGQVLQVLPVYWLTGNIILCYNLLFLSTFVLSALGTYLLVHDLTGDRRAAFLAGLVYGFLPYRIASVPHLQVLSSQWMPFALYGLNRFVTNGSYRALAGGTAALVMQNWSCGYYLLYFAPFVPLFTVHRMWSLGRPPALAHSVPASHGEVSPKGPSVAKADTRVRAWLGLMAAAVITLVLTLPFLIPYLEAQRIFGFVRPFGEVVGFSANVWSYVTASENLWLWGEVLRVYPRPEGETFLGFVPILLAVAAVAALVKGQLEANPSITDRRRWVRVLLVLMTFMAVIQFVALASAVAFGGFDLKVLGTTISARTPQRLLIQFVAAAGLVLAFSPRARAVLASLVRTPLFFFAAATLLAIWLSLGPAPSAGDARVSGLGIYSALYNYVPGFNGVRVPARYAMIAGLFLSVMAGYGVAALVRLRPDATLSATLVRPKPDATLGADVASGFSRTSVAPTLKQTIVTCAVAALILIEAVAVPMEMNRAWAQNEAMPPARVYPAAQAPAVYQRVAALPAGSAITEFPFGDAAWEIRYVYYAATHWKPITNGYSGSFPPEYSARVAHLRSVAANPEAAWQALIDSGSTHVVLHPAAFADPAGAQLVRGWLMSRGARMLEHFPDGDTLFALP